MNTNPESLPKSDEQIPAPNSDPLAAANETLRLIASVSPPQGLEERIHLRLRSARNAPKSSRFWPGWNTGMSSPMRAGFAVAALVLAALVGGGWEFHRINAAKTAISASDARQAPAVSLTPVQAPAQVPPPSKSGFSTANSMRVPPTLNRLHVPPAPKKRIPARKTAQRQLPPQPDSAQH